MESNVDPPDVGLTRLYPQCWSPIAVNSYINTRVPFL